MKNLTNLLILAMGVGAGMCFFPARPGIGFAILEISVIAFGLSQALDTGERWWLWGSAVLALVFVTLRVI